MKVTLLIAQPCPTPYDPVDYSLPVSSVMGFSRHENWRGLPCLPPGNRPHLRIEPGLLYCRLIFYNLSHEGCP